MQFERRHGASPIIGSRDTSQRVRLRSGWRSRPIKYNQQTGIWFRVFWPRTGSYFVCRQDRLAGRPNSARAIRRFSTVSSGQGPSWASSPGGFVGHEARRDGRV